MFAVVQQLQERTLSILSYFWSEPVLKNSESIPSTFQHSNLCNEFQMIKVYIQNRH